MFLANRKHTIQGSFGSLIAYSGLHVNPMANLIPLSTFSTPDINADARPTIGSIFCSTCTSSSRLGSDINRPPSYSLLWGFNTFADFGCA